MPHAPGPPQPPPGPTRPTRPWSAGRIVTLVIGSLIALLSLGLITVGLVALVFDQTQRDADGFIETEAISLESDGYAIAGSGLQIDTNVPGWLQARSVVGDVRLIVESTDGRPIFVGVAHEEDVAAYLADLDYDEVTRISGGSRFTPFAEAVTVTYLSHPGGAPQSLPADQDVWASWTSGAGEQTLTVELETGRWVAVAMNADASADVQVVASVAVEVPALPTVAIALLVIGGVGLFIGAFMIYLAVRERRQPEG